MRSWAVTGELCWPLLFDMAKRVNEVGGEETDRAARSMADEDPAPTFPGPWQAPARWAALARGELEGLRKAGTGKDGHVS